jgi:hypothetical protein
MPPKYSSTSFPWLALQVWQHSKQNGTSALVSRNFRVDFSQSRLLTRSCSITAGLTGFTLFITIVGILLSAFMLTIPVVYEKHDKFVRLARALKEVRVGFILIGTGTTASLIIAYTNPFIVTTSFSLSGFA